MSRSSRDTINNSEEETERLLVGSSTASVHPQSTAGTPLRTISIPSFRSTDSSRNDKDHPVPKSPSAEKSKGSLASATGLPSPFQHTPSCEDTTIPAASPTISESAQLLARLSQSSSKHEGKQDSMSIPLCRICLEEDDCAALCEPCGCSGTQRHAHHACIQRWVQEKGHLRCEVCEQQYRGTFILPPPPQPSTAEAAAMERLQLLIHDPATGHEALDLLDESDRYYRRNPGMSWCFSFILFIMFLVVIHHTMVISDNMNMDSDADSGTHLDPASGGGSGPGSGSGSGSGPGGGADQEVAGSLTLFLFWVATKAFIIGLPLYTVMKIAARQARREQYEALMRATASYAASDPTVDRRVLLHLGLRAVRPGREEETGMVVLGPGGV